MTAGDLLWAPAPDERDRSRIGAFVTWLEERLGRRFESYDELWAWSVADLDEFWSSVARWFGVGLAGPALPTRTMPAAWFPDARLNYARHALLGPRERPFDPAAPAIVSHTQGRDPARLTRGELVAAVARVQAGLVRLGVGPGDRVAAYLPNVAETVIAFLATAGLGAVWSSCAPEFGTASVIARFAPIEPTVLLAVDGYRYGAKVVDRTADLTTIATALPSLGATVVLPHLDPTASVPGTVAWSELVATDGPLRLVDVPFDHPLYILHSSGTTGPPKAIVHGHGGILLEHLKVLGLQTDLGPGDVFYWFTTTGWMMWNYLVSGLAVGATIVGFDGDPGWPDLGATWRLAAAEGVTAFGTSPSFLGACRRAGLRPGAEVDLSALRHLGSTGAPLGADGYEWVYDDVGQHLVLTSISGGTDVCTAFVGGSRLSPVRSGVIAAPCLGVEVAAVGPTGEVVVGEQGELVVTTPMPSMPIGFWGDDDGRRYRAAYFERYPGRWHHGDWITVAADRSCVVSGRSDATLNRGGVRLGTADFYAVVDALPEVADSLVIHLDQAGDDRLLLFLAMAGDAALDDGLRTRLTSLLRSQLSPRHVPDDILVVPAVPRTLSGKRLEVPVKRILLGADPSTVATPGALADPGALAPFADLAAFLTRA